jgi:glycosyltransferase involved in cell wall biosynthesis
MKQTNRDKIAVAIVYWGRLGAGPALMNQIVSDLAKDTRFDVYASPSLQSELLPQLPAERILAVTTFSGPLSLAFRSVLAPFIIHRLVRRLSRANTRAIVTIMPHIWGCFLQRAAQGRGIRTILMVHDADPHPGEVRPILDWLVRQEVRHSDRVVTLSNYVATRLIARRDVVESRLVRLFHPIFRFGSKSERKPAMPFRLLFFGRILPYKGVPLLLEAFSLLRAQGVDCILRIVGRGEIDAPIALLKQTGLTIEQGWIKPEMVKTILAEADAVVLPYLEASQSGVATAAYGAGLPVVGTPVGGLHEQIIEGETGLLAKSVGANDLAEAIRALIETPGLYDACCEGVSRYDAEHSPKRFSGALGDIIIDTLGGIA